MALDDTDQATESEYVSSDDLVLYRWQGVRTPDGTGWVEHFGNGGKARRLPPRDLTATDVANLSDLQRSILASPAGQRLYVAVGDGEDATPSKPKRTGASTRQRRKKAAEHEQANETPPTGDGESAPEDTGDTEPASTGDEGGE